MKVEYQMRGRGAPLLYISGLEGSGKLFYKQSADLERDHTIITFQLRGAGPYRLAELVEDIKWIIEDAGLGRVTVLGESLGGLLAMAAALEHPHLFERMILVNTFPFFTQRAKIKLGVWLYSRLPKIFIKLHRTRAARRVLFSLDVAEEDRRLFREHTRDVSPEGYLSRLRIIRDTDLRERLGEIDVPSLVVAGTADRLIDSVAAAKLLVERLPRARLKLLEGTGHMALISGRVRVRDWLAELDGI